MALAALAALALAVGCQGTSSRSRTDADGVPRRGGTLVLGSISDVDSWNEYVSQQSFANTLLRRMFLRLAAQRGDARQHPPTFGPELAESWTTSADGRSLTFRLREASWSDGAPVTAADVRFSWRAQTSPEVAWTGLDAKRHITEVRVDDARTVTFHFDMRYPYQLADAVEGGIVPEHVFGRVPFERWRTHDWSADKIASGPFVLEEHRPADEITLVRNPRYHRQGYPLLDRVVVRIVPDSANLQSQLVSGDIDYLEGISPREARGLQGVTLVAFDQPQYDFLGWNGARPPFDDARVRRALTLAIDREALVEDLLYGYGRVSVGPVVSFWWGANRDIEPWPHDPERALRLLAECGYRPAADDGTLMRDGRPLTARLVTNAGNRLREAMLVKIQEQLGRIGVRVEVQPLEMRTMRQRVTAGDFDGFLGGWVFAGKVDLRSLFASEDATLNVVSYRSAEVDRLLDRLDEAEDWRAMKPALDAIQLRIHEDQPYTFLYETQRLAGVDPRVRGVEVPIPFDPLARLESYWVER